MDTEKVSLGAGEHIEYINSSLPLIVSREHTFGTDALLLGFFASPKRRETVCDLGSGCGIIPFYFLREGLETKITCVEIQEQAINQLRRSVRFCGIEESFEILNADLRNTDNLKKSENFGRFDLVTMNPPYKALGSGIISSSASDKIARHDSFCTLDDASCAASKLLRFGGRFAICLKPERLCDAVMSMKKYNIEPKRLRFVALRTGKPPWLMLLEGKLGSRSGLSVEKELYIEGNQDSYSQEMRKIVGEYYDGKEQKTT